MGMRLVVTIKNGDKRLCNIYYHWGAYTYSALLQTKKIVDCIYNHVDETEDEFLLRLIHFVEQDGGGIAQGKDSREWKYITKKYPHEKFKEEGIGRNDGLICLSNDGMDDSQSWSEGDLEIDLEEYTIHNYVVWSYESIDDYNENWNPDEFRTKTLDEIIDVGYDITCIDIDDIDKVIKALDEVYDDVCRCGNEIYDLITG